jgi:competence protein ComEA
VDTRLRLALAVIAVAAAAALIWRPTPHRELPPAFPEGRPRASERPSELTVYVAGAVKSPGVYTVPGGSRALVALKAAGGPNAAAELTGVNLAERLEDGQELLVPDRSSETDLGRHRRARGAHGHAHKKHGRHRRDPPSDDPIAPVDVNRAGADALARVPGIGDALADRIVAFREANGPFDRLDDLLDVAGMSAAKLDRAQPYLQLGR